jgi:hypothetical protein
MIQSTNEFFHTVSVSKSKCNNERQLPVRIELSKFVSSTPFRAKTGSTMGHVNKCDVSQELLGQKGHLTAARSKKRKRCPEEQIKTTRWAEEIEICPRKDRKDCNTSTDSNSLKGARVASSDSLII